ncbi:putative DNA processing protein DprA [Microbacterium sp. 8M]|uniref:DNA-processing protein DprA n=1 Tax=Microbacterium sp. 8M TaxID=2653153 RepID=UPI0012F25B9C|nr:DNA-processing protein DprA [Microbacterium sp. 8M]VXC24979.1 putative DNA processing protein DprA [Microbacterium sp. 8M]
MSEAAQSRRPAGDEPARAEVLGARDMRRSLKALRADARFLREADRIRPDGGDPAVRDALIWSLLCEPGDGVAGALIEALGPTDALDAVFGGTEFGGAVFGGTGEDRRSTQGAGDAGDRAVVDRDRPAAAALRDARRRWAPRLAAEPHLAALRTAVRIGARLLLPTDREWPVALADLGAHAPRGLWLRGDATALGDPGVAIVGARASSSYGEHVAGDLAGELAAEGLVVFSGGAYGIDGTAHRAALRAGGRTIALLAGGVDRPYPSGHAQLFERIAASGALVSEVACTVAPTKWRFLARNRVISALAGATVVVEAGARSGSLNTAGHAAELGRPLGAVPGPITSTTSAGCHRLLRDYDARCITSAADVRELLGIGRNGRRPAQEDPDMIRLADALNARTARNSLDLARSSGLSEDRVEALLGILELDGSAIRDERGWRSVLR